MAIPREEYKERIINKMLLTEKEINYLAGFIDGDGSIYVKIVQAKDRKFKYAIRVEISLTQKSSRRWFLEKWQKKLGCGKLNCAEKSPKRTVDNLTIGQMGKVRELLFLIKNNLMIKKGQSKDAITLIDNYYKKKNMTLDEFCSVCLLADKITAQNDSRKTENSITGASVIKELKENTSFK